ncbi:MAG: leucine-rich repeat protein [Selenomonadaceae bacterium]|nr:leucine-rich repeat protein [Selenomonadaceae bacterium]
MKSGMCGENLTWTLDDEGTLTISGHGAMEKCYLYDLYDNMTTWYDKYNSVKNIIIEKGITSIADCAFIDYKSLAAIKIPKGVTSIGCWAFSARQLLCSVDIPDSVTSIGRSAFSGCTALTNVKLPDSVTSIGRSAFNGCTALTNVKLPDSVTSISKRLFSGCTSLINVEIPNSITSIGERSFSYCTSLTSIKIPESVTSIGKLSFEGCDSLKEIYYKRGTKIDLHKLTAGHNAELIPYDEFPPDITEKEPDKPKDAVEKISPPAEEVSKVDSNPTINHEENFAVYSNTKYDRTESFAPSYSKNWSNVDDKTVAIRKAAELAAMNIVMNIERNLGFVPDDVSSQNLGYDIKSTSHDGKISRLIEVKGRYIDAESVTVSRNEIIAALNNPDNFILAIVKLDADKNETVYLKRPFEQPPDKAALSINFSIQKLIEAAKIIPR